ncbi:hypothetical protein A7K73_09385 [Candidatus Methylacidiphilum fumarolicum]|uniref:Uncharacterized protein n=2 Tax=Candidatus Methylacidiphilum fumarolicum TaxID=591154 RepID=I0JYB6_METFB|nr:hypothetical protein [Candidatus Methylacidiphilum fumarolicum]TFE67230.1 hypothetical protein A7K73_09385 [Candidatus Methylacidiphilum fumarolicum]TFE76724.1 hypothetical protein A7D33_00465 [Candidatus Methylacidiphilum fumarolicum]CAI9085369.1 conserved exported protein of unknown function [Candidatus Methylacidiphilum fumarolicum]CCG92235.1 conserved exported hypothetical protein [Methylacidiphilum fumariolicum SolV]
MKKFAFLSFAVGIMVFALGSYAQVYPIPDFPIRPNLKEPSIQPPFGTPFVQTFWSTWEVKGHHFQQGMPQEQVIKIMGEEYERFDVMNLHYRRGRIMTGYIAISNKQNGNLIRAHVLKWTYKDSSHYVYDAYFIFSDEDNRLTRIFYEQKPLDLIAQ